MAKKMNPRFTRLAGGKRVEQVNHHGTPKKVAKRSRNATTITDHLNLYEDRKPATILIHKEVDDFYQSAMKGMIVVDSWKYFKGDYKGVAIPVRFNNSPTQHNVNPLVKTEADELLKGLGRIGQDVFTFRAITIPTKPKEKLLPQESEKILGLVQVTENGMMAFDNDQEKFTHWLNSNIPALDHQKPMTLLNTAAGVDLVNKELLRIEYSVY